MSEDTVGELTAEHLDSEERRKGLNLRGHAGFLYNNLIRRLSTSPWDDLGAHFLPSLLLAAVGILIYLLGGEGPQPGSTPSWPLIPLGIGLVWLIVQTCRAHGFPTEGAIGPATVMGLGALANAWVLPIVYPEDRLIWIGLVLMGLAEPGLFVLLARRGGEALSWQQMREALLTDRSLRRVWHTLTLGLVLIAIPGILAPLHPELPATLRFGAAITGLGLAWMAQSFYAITRPSRGNVAQPDTDGSRDSGSALP